MSDACKDVVELVTEYLDDAMPPSDRARFEAHLRECPACVVYLEQVKATIALAGTLDLRALDVPGDVRDVFRRWRRSR